MCRCANIQIYKCADVQMKPHRIFEEFSAAAEMGANTRYDKRRVKNKKYK
jgi:hypothetical protein